MGTPRRWRLGTRSCSRRCVTAWCFCIASSPRQPTDNWLWGLIHQVRFEHFIGQGGLPLFDLGPFAAPGARYTVSPGNYSLHTDDFTFSFGPSQRFVVVLDPAGIRAVNCAARRHQRESRRRGVRELQSHQSGRPLRRLGPRLDQRPNVRVSHQSRRRGGARGAQDPLHAVRHSAGRVMSPSPSYFTSCPEGAATGRFSNG